MHVNHKSRHRVHQRVQFYPTVFQIMKFTRGPHMNTSKIISNRSLFILSVLVAISQRLVLTGRAVQTMMANGHIPNLHMVTVDVFNHWDSGWYIAIAKNGYTNFRQTAFFPMYPFLMRVVHDCTNISYAAAGVVISFASLIFALFFFAAYVRNVFHSTRVAVVSMLLLACFPTAYYFDAIYTESVFLFFTFAGLYAASCNRFWLAGICVGLATLTRNTGIFESFILLFEYIRYKDMNLRFWSRSWWSRIDRNVLGILIPTFMFAVFCLIEKRLTGQFFPFLQAEKTFSRTFMPSWNTFVLTYSMIFKAKGWSREYYCIEFFSYLLMVVMLFLHIKYLKKSWIFTGWLLYFIAVLWATTSQPCPNIQDYVVSFPRYALMLFPAFVFAADLIKRQIWLCVVVLAVSSIFLVKLSGIFFIGKWIA
jgi:Gpi18-like mannosyltransferase